MLRVCSSNTFKRITRGSMTSTPTLSNKKREASPDATAKRPKIDNNKISEAAATKIKLLLKSNSSPWKPIVWIDCEMTGLNVQEDHIIEICCLITDGKLDLLDMDGYESTIYYPESVLENMSEWCVNQHGKSGLTSKILANTDRTLEKVENELVDYIKKFIGDKNKGVMAGNSIHMDRIFMQREFPKVIDYLHYRLIDVSSIMEVGYRHNPELMKAFPKKTGNHTARSDILESIQQLKWYQENYFKNESESREVIERSKELEKREN